jgi:hypothetical protein
MRITKPSNRAGSSRAARSVTPIWFRCHDGSFRLERWDSSKAYAVVRPILRGLAWTYDLPYESPPRAHPITLTLDEARAGAEAWLRDAEGRVGA